MVMVSVSVCRATRHVASESLILVTNKRVLTLRFSLCLCGCVLCAVLRACAARQTPAQQLMAQMGKHGTVGEVHPNSLIKGYYRGWMTAPEMVAFDAKKYDLFNKLADAYNEEHGYGYGKEKKRKRSAREQEREGEYIQYA